MSNYPRPAPAALLRIYKLAAPIMRDDLRVHEVFRSGRLVTPFYSTRGREITPSAKRA